jgi:stage IV sporulation protein B
MRKTTKILLILLLLINLLPSQVFARELVAVGQVVGLQLQDGTLTVAAFDEELGQAAKNAGLAVGDKLLRIDGKRVHGTEDLRRALSSSKGMITLDVLRGNKQVRVKFEPAITAEGPKLGLYLKQGVTGVGTVTFYDAQTGLVGTLGHGVNNTSGQLLQMEQGNLYETAVMSVRKGKSGEPGQLMGSVISKDPIGSITANTPQGVFGISDIAWEGTRVETASWDQIKTGSATILSTVSGREVEEYTVEILKIYPQSTQAGRNLLIRITDPVLLEKTGGIVQGMSGSPIIQDGKLVGAVTHVLVNDPTTGYGIFIENMLDAAA